MKYPRMFMLFFLLMIASPTTLANSDQILGLICRTNNKSECYPRLFVPTNDFQVVHEDQDLPPGLHVRLNIQTGLKEAKLYDGGDSDLINTVETQSDSFDGIETIKKHDLTIESKTRVVQAIDAPTESHSILPKAFYPAVLDSGDRTIHHPVDGDADGTAFKDALSVLTTSRPFSLSALLAALSTLEDLARDIYWGLTLAQSEPAITALIVLLQSFEIQVSSDAALVLGNTLHNNPEALSEVLTLFPSLPGLVQTLLWNTSARPTFQTPSSSAHQNPRCKEPSHSLPPRTYSRLIFLLSSLLSGPLPSSDGLHGLLSDDHVADLLSDFAPQMVLDDLGWSRPRIAIADFVLDRLASAEAAPRFVELAWRVWNVRNGHVSQADIEDLRSHEWVLIDQAEVEARGGEDSGWIKVNDGYELAGPLWVRKLEEREEAPGWKALEPQKFTGKYQKAMVDSCLAFDRAIEMWNFEQKALSGKRLVGDVEGHVVEAQIQVKERLKEAGCNGCSCGVAIENRRLIDEL